MQDHNEPSARERKAAFSRHLRNIIGDDTVPADTLPAGVPESGPMTEIQAMMLGLEADKRLMAGMMGSMPGQASEVAFRKLQGAHDLYARVIADGPDRSSFVDKARARYQMGQAQEFMGNASDAMRDEPRALEFFARAVAHYDEVGRTDEAAKLRTKLARLQEAMSGDVDATLDRLDRTTADPMSEVDRLIALAGATLKGGDSFGALEHLKTAEELLEREGIAEQPPKSLAEDLANTIMGLQNGQMQAGGTPIERAMSARATYASLYSLYVQVYSATEPGHPDFAADLQKAADYQAKWDAMGSKQSNADFSNAMLGLLHKLK